MARIPAACFVVTVLCWATSSFAGPPGASAAPELPPPRAIPGVTAPDAFPNGCVDCHIEYPDLGLDTRFGTLLRRWQDAVEPEVLEKARGAAPDGMTLTGRHPDAAAALDDVPAKCRTCHGDDSAEAIPFSRLMHRLHLTGGERSPFLTLFGGECTHCHKLDPASGSWTIRSAPEN